MTEDNQYIRRQSGVPTRRFLDADDGPEHDAAADAAAYVEPTSAGPAPSALRDQAQTLPETGKPMAVYLLHLAGILTSGLTNLVAVILAYVFRENDNEVARSHLVNGATIFWGALVFNVIATGLLLAGGIAVTGFFALVESGQDLVLTTIGPSGLLLLGGSALLYLYAFVWFLVRTIKGIVLASDKKPYPNPGSWGF